MSRIQFYSGAWTDPPPTGEIYEVPRNPTTFDPVDEDFANWNGGLDIGNRYERYYDNREKTAVWDFVPAFQKYVTMIHNFEDYQYSSELYMNFGNSLLPGIYSTGDEWHKVRVTGINTDNDTGSSAIISGGVTYNYYKKVTLRVEDLGAM